MEYDVFILRRAQRELESLPKSNYERSRDAVAALSSIQDPPVVRNFPGAKAGVSVQVTIESSTKLMIVRGESPSCMLDIEGTFIPDLGTQLMSGLSKSSQISGAGLHDTKKDFRSRALRDKRMTNGFAHCLQWARA
jgi:hypothetical protein